MVRILLSFLLVLGATVSVFSNGSDAVIVTGVEVDGLWRSSPTMVERITGISVGWPSSPSSLAEAKRKLLETNLFEEVDCRFSERDPQHVVIRVKEKLNLMILPYNVSFSATNYGGGLMLTDSNFLGEGKIFSLGTAFSNLGPSGIVSFVDRNLGGTSATLVATLDGWVKNRTVKDIDHKELTSLNLEQVAAEVQLTLSPAPHWQIVPGLRYAFVKVVDGTVASWDNDGSNLFIPEATLLYDQTSRNGYYLSGLWLAAKYSHAFSFGEISPYDSLLGRLNWATDFFDFGFLETGLAGELGTRTLQVQGGLKGKGFRTLPPGSYSAINLGSFFEVNVPVVRSPWGTVAIGTFYEVGWYEFQKTYWNSSLDNRYFYGPGVGVYLFLTQFPLPAIHADLSYNQPASTWNFSVSLGLSLE